MSTADTKSLASLHARLAAAMSDALDSEVARIKTSTAMLEEFKELSADLDEETAKQLGKLLALDTHARVDNSLLKTVAGFLKDNNITADLSAGDEVDETMETLRELQKKRRVAATPLDTLQ